MLVATNARSLGSHLHVERVMEECMATSPTDLRWDEACSGFAPAFSRLRRRTGPWGEAAILEKRSSKYGVSRCVQAQAVEFGSDLIPSPTRCWDNAFYWPNRKGALAGLIRPTQRTKYDVGVAPRIDGSGERVDYQSGEGAVPRGSARTASPTSPNLQIIASLDIARRPRNWKATSCDALFNWRWIFAVRSHTHQ